MKQDKNLPLKEKFLQYYRILPIQKLAAKSIGRCEDTITDWKKDDVDFSDQIGIAESDWAKDNTTKVKSREWLLERVMKDHFSPRTEIDNTGDILIKIVSEKPEQEKADNAD